MNEIDPEQIGPFIFPDSVLQKIYDMTGDDDSSRGFIVAYVSNDGMPVIHTKVSSQIVEMGLRKALEDYLSVEQLERLDDIEED